MLIGFFIPISISFVHSFEKHEHTVCNAKNVKHFHKVENDCSNLHYLVHSVSFITQSFKILISPKIISKVITDFSFEYFVSIPFKSPRAPPVL